MHQVARAEPEPVATDTVVAKKKKSKSVKKMKLLEEQRLLDLAVRQAELDRKLWRKLQAPER